MRNDMTKSIYVKVVYEYTLEVEEDIEDEELLQKIRDSEGMVVCEPKITFIDSSDGTETTIE